VADDEKITNQHENILIAGLKSLRGQARAMHEVMAGHIYPRLSLSKETIEIYSEKVKSLQDDTLTGRY
jgi:hypothetical protein